MCKNVFDNVLWTCAHCERWWLSQWLAPENWRLVKLTAVSKLPLEMSHAPAWHVSGPDPSVCPECGATMTLQEQGQQQPAILTMTLS
ncbi:MAG: hypothetical protein IPM53_06525 [Anaerolineaceae bacterium]|nr:hypothetical protein [Anaerolineaceae bacterium]